MEYPEGASGPMNPRKQPIDASQSRSESAQPASKSSGEEQEDTRGTSQSVREANHALDIRPSALDPGSNDVLTKSRLLWAPRHGTDSLARKPRTL